MPRVPLDPEWQTDGDEWWTHRAPTSPADLTVYDVDPEPVGWLELPDGSVIDVYPEREPFGYARHLGGSMGKQKPSVADRALAVTAGPGAKCTVGKALRAMEPEQRADYEAALAIPPDDLMHTALAVIFQEDGYDVRSGAVSRHRRGTCCCGRS